MSSPNNSTLNDDGEVPMTEDSFISATTLLFAPFLLIPAAIIAVRLVKYLYRAYQAKLKGKEGDMFEDPLAELGLKVKIGDETAAELRKMRKERKKLEKEMQDKRDVVLNRSKQVEEVVKIKAENDAIDQTPQHHHILDFVRFPAAEHYLDTLKQKTAQTWYDKLSPNAVREWVNTSRYARIWMILQVFCTALSIVNYVSLTYLASREDRDERKFIKILDIGYASFFALDYILSFYIAEDRLVFYCNPMSIVDLISIITPFVYLFIASPTKYVWFIGFVRIFRATRILRTYRLLSFTQSEQQRELTIFILNFFNFIFFSASTINATEALQFQDEKPSLKNWHDSLYYIMVTFSTIGFGDLTPTSTISRIVVMCLIGLVIVYVPYQTSKIVEIYNSLSKFQRAQHRTSSQRPHIILAGKISYSSIVDFCREFFVAEEVTSVVILSADEPNLEIRRLLNHPFYRTRLEYLRGNLMSNSDLRRAQIDFAQGYFLLTSRSSADIETGDGEDSSISSSDTQLVMQALFAKTNFPGIPIYAQVNDHRSTDYALQCGIDRLVCIDEIKSTMFASNCLCPGIQTLILNLIHSYKFVEPETGSDFWTQEYQCGLANHIYSFRIPEGLVGLKFSSAIRAIYESFNTMVIALISSNSGFSSNSIRFNISMDYVLKNDDIAFGIGDGEDDFGLRVQLYFNGAGLREVIQEGEFNMEMDNSTNVKGAEPSPLISGFSEVPRAESPIAKSIGNLDKISEDLKDHIIITGYLPIIIILNFVKTIRSSLRRTGIKNGAIADKDTPIVIILENLPDSIEAGNLWSEIISFQSIYLIKGRPAERSTLIKANVATCSRIVLFAENPASESDQTCLSDAQAVFMVKLIQKDWPNVQYLIELVDGSTVKYFTATQMQWNNRNLRMQSILNNYSLSINERLSLYKSLRSEGLENTRMVYQLYKLMMTEKDKPADRRKSVKRKEEALKTESMEELNRPSSIKQGKQVAITEQYLQKALEEAELNDSGISPYPVFHFDKHFAAGMIASSSFMQSLLCQSFFRPFIIDVVKGLIMNVCLLPLPSPEGTPYVEVVEKCLRKGYIPLGLYRNGNQANWNSESPFPYVYTNCRPGDRVTGTDLIFVINRNVDQRA